MGKKKSKSSNLSTSRVLRLLVTIFDQTHSRPRDRGKHIVHPWIVTCTRESCHTIPSLCEYDVLRHTIVCALNDDGHVMHPHRVDQRAMAQSALRYDLRLDKIQCLVAFDRAVAQVLIEGCNICHTSRSVVEGLYMPVVCKEDRPRRILLHVDATSDMAILLGCIEPIPAHQLVSEGIIGKREIDNFKIMSIGDDKLLEYVHFLISVFS